MLACTCAMSCSWSLVCVPDDRCRHMRKHMFLITCALYCRSLLLQGEKAANSKAAAGMLLNFRSEGCCKAVDLPSSMYQCPAVPLSLPPWLASGYVIWPQHLTAFVLTRQILAFSARCMKEKRAEAKCLIAVRLLPIPPKKAPTPFTIGLPSRGAILFPA